MKVLLVVVLGLAVVVGALYAATVYQAAYKCTACIETNGGRTCRSAASATRDQAERTAIETACADVTSNMTAGIRCQETPPASLECRKR